LANAFGEADLRLGLKHGGQVLSTFIVARSEEEFVIDMRCNWIRGRDFRIIRTWRGPSGNRIFRSPLSAWGFVRKFAIPGRVTVYSAGDPEFRQFVGMSPDDLGEFVHTAPVTAADGAHPPPAHHANPE
jgi:hypothetical protein